MKPGIHVRIGGFGPLLFSQLFIVSYAILGTRVLCARCMSGNVRVLFPGFGI
jgi:hypothetical protein